MNGFRGRGFRDQSNKSLVLTLRDAPVREDSFYTGDDRVLNGGPALLEKDGVKTIWSRALVWFKIHNCLMDFQVSGGRDKGRAADRVDARKAAKKSPRSLSPSS